MDSTNKFEARPLTTHSDRPRGKVPVNDNYCVTQRGFVEIADICEQLPDFKCKLFCCESCTFCHQAAIKERHKTHCKTNKTCEKCFSVDQLSSVQSVSRDRPKGHRGIPSWNLSLVLHQLTKAPFKNLIFKTVFLLALGSGKHRSEIHVWLKKNVRYHTNWSKVSLYPLPSVNSESITHPHPPPPPPPHPPQNLPHPPRLHPGVDSLGKYF